MGFFDLLLATTALSTPAPSGDQGWDAVTGPWLPQTMTTPSILGVDGVQFGGEGAQYPRDVQVSESDPTFIIGSIDVMAMRRSLDGGDTWGVSLTGYLPRGGIALAIDPLDDTHVFVVGTSAAAQAWNGLWRSTDRGASWAPVRQQNVHAQADRRNQIAFDRTTGSAGNACTRLWWSYGADEAGETSTIFVSEDAGATWTARDTTHGGASIAAHPTTANKLYAADGAEVYVSTDGGATWSALTSGVASPGGNWLEVATNPAEPDSLWATTKTKVWKSADQGASWTEIGDLSTFEGIASETYTDHSIRLVRCSPAAAERLAVTVTRDSGGLAPYFSRLFVTHDSGATWSLADETMSPGGVDLSWYYTTEGADYWNTRISMAAWHPTDPDICWTIGNPYFVKSTDGGLNFQWASDGISMSQVNGGWNFNANDPELLAFGFLDHQAAYFEDVGQNADGVMTASHWPLYHAGSGGNGAACLAVRRGDGGVQLYGGAFETWNGVVGDVRRRLVTATDGATPSGYFDGGNGDTYSWTRKSRDCALVYPDGTNDIFFVGEFRTTDGGQTFTGMRGDNCKVVVSHGPAAEDDGQGGTAYPLFGTGDGTPVTIVRSLDKGASWTVVLDTGDSGDPALKDTLHDAAYNPQGGAAGDKRYLFVADGNRLLRMDLDIAANTTDFTVVDMSAFEDGGTGYWTSVCVDPTDPSRMYACQKTDVYSYPQGPSLVMSTDGGDIWQALSPTSAAPEAAAIQPGNAHWVRVHPTTGLALFTGGGYGQFWYDPARA